MDLVSRYQPPANASPANSQVATVANIAAMLALVPLGPVTINVLGYYAPNDGGGGVFNYSSTSIATPDNGFVFAAPVGGNWLRNSNMGFVSPRWFGAVGDGVANDTNFAQACFNYALLNAIDIYIPPGDFLVGNVSISPLVAATPLTVFGAGRLSKLLGDGSDDIVRGGNLTGELLIKDLSFGGSSGRCIYVQNSTKPVTLNDCEFYGSTRVPASGFFAAVVLSNCNDVTIRRPYIHDCGQVGTKTERTYAIISDASTIVYRWNVSDAIVTLGDMTNGIALFDIANSVVDGCKITGGGVGSIYDSIGGDGYGIVLYAHTPGAGTEKNRVVNCDVSNTAGSGIYLASCYRTLCSLNQVHDACLVLRTYTKLIPNGLIASTDIHGSFEGNILSGGYSQGIELQGDDVSVSGGNIRNTGAAGVSVLGASARCSFSSFAIDTTLGTAGYVVSTSATNFAAIAVGDQLVFKVDGGAPITVTFQAGDTTGPKIAARIQAAVANTVAVANYGTDVSLPGSDSLQIQSRSQGAASSIQIVSGTAGVLVALGLAASTGTGSGSNCFLVAAGGISFAKVLGVTAYGGTLNAGLYIPLATSSSFIGCDGSSNAGAGLAVLSGSSNTILGVHANSNTTNGLDLRDTNGTVQGCQAHSNGVKGASLNGVNLKLYDNDLTGNTSAGGFSDSGTNTTNKRNVLVSASAARDGTATLVGGTKTVNNAEVLASTRIRIYPRTVGGNFGALSYTIVSGTSFTVISTDANDTSTFDWELDQ